MIFTVAIDGPAAAGKGTIASALAQHFHFAKLDTGSLYRAVGKKMLLAGKDGDAVRIARQLSTVDLKRNDLRSAEVAQSASRIATIPAVRAALIDFQRDFARRAGGAILDGRDIGTVICPQAEVKLFVTASVETRAQRRFLELQKMDNATRYEQVLANVKERDKRDSTRDVAPLIAADDAVILDTTTLSIPDAIETAIAIVQRALP